MALRDAVGHRAGRRGHLPGGRRAPATRRSWSSRSRSRRTPRAGPRSPSVYPHPIAFNALPHIDVFLDNGYTKEEWKVVTESRKILHLPDLRVSCTAVRVPVFIGHSEAVHVETRDPITPAGGARAVRRRAGRRGPGRPGGQRVPAGDRRRRHRRGLRGPGPPGPVDPRQPRASPSGSCRDNLRKGAASNAVEMAEILVERDWIRKGERAPAGGEPGDAPRDPRRAPGRRSRRSRARSGPAPRCRLHEGRTHAVPGRGRSRHRGRVRGRGPGLQRGPRGPAVRRARRRPARAAARAASAGSATTCSSPTSSSAGRPTTATREPDEIAACCAVPAPPARGAGPGGRRDAGPVLDGRRSCPAPGSARSTARPPRPIPRPAPATRSCSRCTTPRRRCAPRRSSETSFEDVARVPACCSCAPASAEPASTRRPPSRSPRRPSPPRPRQSPRDPRPRHAPAPRRRRGRTRARRRLPAHPVLPPRRAT